jgi:trk system potassium uptake protein TrkA
VDALCQDFVWTARETTAQGLSQAEAARLPRECALAAVIRGGQLLIPRADLVLQPADEVLAVVHAAHTAELAGVLGPGDWTLKRS